MSPKEQMKYWGIAAAVFFALLWLLGNVIMPFVVAGAVAYCLDPIADRLERIGFSRLWATITITAFATLLFVLAALLIVPTLVQQTVGLVETLPRLVTQFRDFLTARFPELLDANSQLSQSLASVGAAIQAHGASLLNSAVSYVTGFVNVLVLIFLVPVITFYLLMDWDRMVAEIDALLPRDHAPMIRQLARDIDETMAAFIRGQGMVMLILGTYYGVALMLVGLQFGLVVGFTAGLISFIPYVGAIVGGGLAFGLALFQFWGQWGWIVAVVAIFLAGQFFEGNILSPNLVGSSVGLHPVWLIFALSAFGSLFGFVGLLVAVPVAAAIGVVARFAVAEYREGRFYRGASEDVPQERRDADN